jgi:hypothetical protein
VREDYPRHCYDCHAAPGELHAVGCDVERCRLCGGQRIGCDCVYAVNRLDVDEMEVTHPGIWENGPTDAMAAKYQEAADALGGRLPWTGEWPGAAEAREFGWFSKWIEGRGWVRCAADDPQAGPDLNRVNAFHAHWDARAGRWVLPTRDGG